MLHLVFQSTFDSSLLDRFERSDDVVFLESAIYRLTKGNLLNDELDKIYQSKINLYVLTCDIETRGILRNELFIGVEAIAYSDLVRMTEKNRVIRTWT
ncbi:MAG: sulfurtransferase complex subunit TusB [Methylococcaceae bacterium]|nr:sulfurtransferase complex subunit TusB [Methylococcaceae bacterium]